MADSQFKGRIGRTVEDSVPWWPAPTDGRQRRPNVLVVVFDDTGWSDFGCFGSEIATPTIDRLAAQGLRYTNFHVTPLCSPTRACLLTGRNHHAVGMRFLADVDTGFPNARGRVDPEAAQLPALLAREGYTCFLVGKWHLTPRHEITPAGPFENWPLSRGFHKFYGFLDGCTDQYCPELYQDNHQVTPPSRAGYHLSEDLADHAIRYITDHAVYRRGEPFYLQLAFGAQHAPFQVPRSYVEKYLDVFAKGWDETRTDRLDRQRAMGLVPPSTRLTPRNPGVRPWAQLNAEERLLAVNVQATYAGFLEHADEQLGRVVSQLERLGALEDTLVMVFADNGASREGGPLGTVNVNGIYGGVAQDIRDELAHLHKVGGPDGPAHYPEGWAMAGNTPFRRYKQFVDLGGVRSPLVVSWPRAIASRGQVRRQFAHVIDLAPTILEAAGVVPADGSFDGRSIAATFHAADAAAPRDTQYFEMLGHRAIWHRGWRAVTEHRVGAAYEDDVWRLYDTSADFSECDDLADRYPERLKELKELWWREATAHGVLPLDDRPLVELLAFRAPLGLWTQSSLTVFADQGHVPFATGLTGTRRSMRVRARLKRRAGDEGVILSSGNVQGGYSLYVQDGRLKFEHLLLYRRQLCVGESRVPEGECVVGFTITHEAGGSAMVELFCDADVVGRTRLPFTSGHLSFWGMDVGRDALSPVSEHYTGEFAFPEGGILDVTIDFLEDVSLEDMSDTVLGTE